MSQKGFSGEVSFENASSNIVGSRPGDSAPRGPLKTGSRGFKAPASGASSRGPCSWCFVRNALQYKTGRQGKDLLGLPRVLHTCDACNHDTAVCRFPGCMAFARALHDDRVEGFCYVHRGILSSWHDWEIISKMTAMGSCSWCLKWSTHEVFAIPMPEKMQSSMKLLAWGASMLKSASKDAVLSSGIEDQSQPAKAANGAGSALWTYECQCCRNFTVACQSCTSAFAFDGQEDCLVCSGGLHCWPSDAREPSQDGDPPGCRRSTAEPESSEQGVPGNDFCKAPAGEAVSGAGGEQQQQQQQQQVTPQQMGKEGTAGTPVGLPHADGPSLDTKDSDSDGGDPHGRNMALAQQVSTLRNTVRLLREALGTTKHWHQPAGHPGRGALLAAEEQRNAEELRLLQQEGDEIVHARRLLQSELEALKEARRKVREESFDDDDDDDQSNEDEAGGSRSKQSMMLLPRLQSTNDTPKEAELRRLYEKERERANKAEEARDTAQKLLKKNLHYPSLKSPQSARATGGADQNIMDWILPSLGYHFQCGPTMASDDTQENVFK